MALRIQPNERGLIRVFAVNRPTTELNLAIKRHGKIGAAADLLGHPLAAEGAELFPAADLAGIGLSGYLAEGYAVTPEQLSPARAKLDALEGYVLLVFSAAFEGQAATLDPGPAVTLIGTFGEAQPDMAVRPMESEAAQPYTGTAQTPPAPDPAKTPKGSLLVLGLILIAGLVLWLALR